MKKILSILLSAVLILTFYTSVFADDSDVLTLDEIGITFHLPETFKNSKGTLIPDAGALDSGTYFVEIIYIAIPEHMIP